MLLSPLSVPSAGRILSTTPPHLLLSAPLPCFWSSFGNCNYQPHRLAPATGATLEPFGALRSPLEPDSGRSVALVDGSPWLLPRIASLCSSSLFDKTQTR